MLIKHKKDNMKSTITYNNLFKKGSVMVYP